MNIIFMEPVYKDYIWGGDRLKKELNKDTPYEKTAESWEISSNKNGICKILNDEYNGKTLADIFDDDTIKEAIFGKKCNKFKEFPLLIKFIDAKDNLSIQVHPDDEYAIKNGLGSGKNEMWYIIDCSKDAKIIGGLNTNLLPQNLKEIIENNQIKDYLNYIDVKPGDSISILAGTLHAILKDIFICEIQQNCDTTYRVYDWDRKDKDGKERQLHKKEAIETIKVNMNPEIVHTDNKLKIQKIASNKDFEVEKVTCEDIFEDNSNEESFYAINIVKGNCKLSTNSQQYELKKGDSFLIPATLGKYVIEGNVEFLKSYVV